MKKNEIGKYRAGAIAYIFDNDNNILIINKTIYKNTDWTLPGGGREVGETVEDNIYRELKEELDIDKSLCQMVGISKDKITYEYPQDVAIKVNKGLYIGQSYNQVVLKINDVKPVFTHLNEEISKVNWVNYQDLINYLHFPNQLERAINVINELMPTIIKQ